MTIGCAGQHEEANCAVRRTSSPNQVQGSRVQSDFPGHQTPPRGQFPDSQRSHWEELADTRDTVSRRVDSVWGKTRRAPHPKQPSNANMSLLSDITNV